jgi:hypothetical protein
VRTAARPFVLAQKTDEKMIADSQLQMADDTNIPVMILAHQVTYAVVEYTSMWSELLLAPARTLDWRISGYLRGWKELLVRKKHAAQQLVD